MLFRKRELYRVAKAVLGDNIPLIKDCTYTQLKGAERLTVSPLWADNTHYEVWSSFNGGYVHVDRVRRDEMMLAYHSQTIAKFYPEKGNIFLNLPSSWG